MERVVAKQFASHAVQNALLPSRQSAYSQFHSTESAVLVVNNDIVCAIDQGHVAGLVLLLPQLGIRHSRPLHTAVSSSGSILYHWSVTCMVPLLRHRSDASIYHPV